jgi:transcriptional regulator with XRE-family HTH domain
MNVQVGELLRSWRDARGVSQERLAARAGVSTRHLSCVETGKAVPGREVLLALAGALEVPLRGRNALLLAAGFAPAYTSSSLDSGELAMVRRALGHVLRKQEPFPAIVFDRLCNLIELNQAAQRMLARLAPAAMPADVATNLLLAILHPDAWKSRVVNWDEVAGSLVERLHREVAAAPGDHGLLELRARALAMPGVPAEWHRPRPAEVIHPFVPVHLRHDGIELRMFTMLTTLGTPLDVTAEELRIETYFPADDATERTLVAWAS